MYLPDELNVVRKLTDLEIAYCKLLTDLKRYIQRVLDSCTKEQNEDFISMLQNDLDREDIHDFHSGYKLLKSDVSLFNVQYLRCIVKLLPEISR